MGANVATVKAPPQTLDTLDDWGGLDALPWSLDAGVWAGAGVYALEGAEEAFSSSAFGGAERIRTASLSGAAALSGALEGGACFSLAGMGGAFSSQAELGGITVGIPLEAAGARSGGGISPVRMRPGGGEGGTCSGQKSALFRVRQSAVSGLHAAGGEAAELFRVRKTGPAEAAALSLEHIGPEYKGWCWTAQPCAPDATWREVVQWP